MKKRITTLALCALLFAPSVSVQAQQPAKVPRVGILLTGSASSAASQVKAFQEGLRELGYVEGKNIVIESRYAEGKTDRLRELAGEHVQLKVDVIFSISTPGAVAAKNATTTIPIVMISGDPVGTGLVDSLARPGGNITGLVNYAPELSGKRLEILKDVVRRVSRVGVIWDPGSRIAHMSFTETDVAARALGLKLKSLEVRGPKDFDAAFQAATRERADAMITMPQPLVNFHRKRIIDFAAKSRLPAIYPNRQFMDDGGLMSYGPNDLDLSRRAATYVDKILKGAKPADLPVEQPTKFELIINLKAAKQIGLTIPQSVLYRADKVIK